MIMTKQLKLCPFCGDNNLRIAPAYYDLGENNTGELFYFVYCDNCDATVGEHGSKNEAVMRWNTQIDHSLKILPEYFNEVVSGNKKSEIRYNDRNYRVGDILSLREWDGRYRGRHVEVRITHILDDERYLQNGYVMLSFELVK